jgi:hypothetical protein
MATPLYKFLKENGYSTYVFPGASEDISSAYQNDNYKMDFSKFVLLNIDLSKMDLDNLDEFNTESLNPITDKGELLIASLRNYVANHEVTIRESLLNNNDSFYNPNELSTTTERIFWKWLRKSGALQFEPAIPNDEYIDSTEFSVDNNLSEDYFKEYIWKERDVTPFNIVNIEDEILQSQDPFDGILKTKYKVTLGSSSNIKNGDRVKIMSEGNINIGFEGSKEFTVTDVSTDDTPPNEGSRNNVIFILSEVPLIWNNFATASLELVYDKVVKYIGEVSSVNNVQSENKSYTEINAYIPDQTGETPDILFRLKTDRNYSPSLQYPILPSQDQPEIIGGEQFESPINTNPTDFPGDQYAYFDLDQKYVNSSGLQNRRTGEYFGVFENNRNAERVAQAPYVYPEFDGNKLDGVTIDFDPLHYTKMNIPTFKSDNFDEFNAHAFNGEAPKDFQFNVVLWYYQTEDISLSPKNNTTTTTETTTETTDSETINTTTVTTQEVVPNADKQTATNLYGITFLNPVNEDDVIEPYTKLVANGTQDGLSYQFNLNLNFNISSEQVIEKYDESKVYSLFGFDLYNEVMRRLAETNDIFLKLAIDVTKFGQDLQNIKNLLYTQTDIRDINFRIDALNQLLLLYQRNQIVDSDSIKVELDQSTNPPSIKLISTDARYGQSYQLPVSLLYNNQDNTVLNNKITVPSGKDFLVNVINDDNSDVTLDNNLNIVLDRDLDFKQTCEIKIYPNNARFNKRLDISILSNLVDNIDTVRGHQLLTNLELPIDNNLNPNIEFAPINQRWDDLNNKIVPTDIGLRKISDNYYVVIKLNPIEIGSFESGDVIYLDNIDFLFVNEDNTPFTSKISGQYEVVGEIENDELVIQITKEDFKDVYDAINNETVLPTHYFTDGKFKLRQPPSIRFSAGWVIAITANDRDSSSLNEKYLIEVKPLKKESL